MTLNPFTAIPAFFNDVEKTRLQEQEQIKTNPHLAMAVEREKRDGHRIAIQARTLALIAVGILLAFLNPQLNVLYYQAILLGFIALGWLQLRMAQVGRSAAELLLILADLVLLAVAVVMPNPFLTEQIPTAFVYRYDSFVYFYIFLALGTLAYSWRTVWAIGIWTATIWLLGVFTVYLLGTQFPDLSAKSAEIFSGFPLLIEELDPNSSQTSVRIQEVFVFIIVAAILALKGWRSNRLLVQQAEVAAERANLSRYFPASMVDVLASTERDVGAVRNQDVAVLFTDIVGFTKIAETYPSENVLGLLRQYHAMVEKAIFDNDGTLDKYLGDGVMATFGTPETGPNDALNAMSAARQIIRETQNLQCDAFGISADEFKVSVGLHYGPVIIGDIGPDRRLEFAVLGDTVNVASRLEAATRELGCQCVVSDALVARLEADKVSDFQERRDLHIRGRQMPVDVWVN